MENSPVTCHNFFSFIQEVGSWLRENTRNEEVEAELMSLYEDVRQSIGEEETTSMTNITDVYMATCFN